MMRRTSPIMLIVAAIGLMTSYNREQPEASRFSNSIEFGDNQARSGECPDHHSSPERQKVRCGLDPTWRDL